MATKKNESTKTETRPAKSSEDNIPSGSSLMAELVAKAENALTALEGDESEIEARIAEDAKKLARIKGEIAAARRVVESAKPKERKPRQKRVTGVQGAEGAEPDSAPVSEASEAEEAPHETVAQA